MSTTVVNPRGTELPSLSRLDPSGAFLSYLVPGLGQMLQGRVAKGLLFFFGVYGLFFYGMYLGQWHNVYLGDTASAEQAHAKSIRLGWNLYNRPQFLGQFWVGMVAWPALYHYWTDAPTESPQHAQALEQAGELPWLRRVQMAPNEAMLNRLQRDSDKRWDLGWVYTVIAGVLNILVIYDALAGPAFVHGVPDGKGGRPA